MFSGMQCLGRYTEGYHLVSAVPLLATARWDVAVLQSSGVSPSSKATVTIGCKVGVRVCGWGEGRANLGGVVG